MNEQMEISAIVPVGERHEKSGALIEQYISALDQTGKRFEVICVLDGRREEIAVSLLKLSQKYPMLRIIQLSKIFGETTALAAGFEYASGTCILTLPSYYQVDPPELTTLVNALNGCDMAIAVRSPRNVSSKFEQVRRDFFHWLVKVLSKEKFLDLGCNVRFMKRKVFEEVPLYGNQHSFLPLLASGKGFRIREVKLRQSPEDRLTHGYGLKAHIERLIDVVTVFFLTKFTKKPLRFFGMIGSITSLIGGAFLLYVVVERLFLGVALAGRPALLLSSLLIVLGLQLFALGLLGELVIFTHARSIKEYTIEKVIN